FPNPARAEPLRPHAPTSIVVPSGSTTNTPSPPPQSSAVTSTTPAGSCGRNGWSEIRMANAPDAPSEPQKTRRWRPSAQAAATIESAKPHATHSGGEGTRYDNQCGKLGKSVRANRPFMTRANALAGHT